MNIAVEFKMNINTDYWFILPFPYLSISEYKYIIFPEFTFPRSTFEGAVVAVGRDCGSLVSHWRVSFLQYILCFSLA